MLGNAKTLNKTEKPLRLPILYGFLIGAIVLIVIELIIFPNLPTNPGIMSLFFLTTLASMASIGLSLSGVRSRLPKWAKRSVSGIVWGLAALDIFLLLILPNFTGGTANDPAPSFGSVPAATVSSTNPNTNMENSAMDKNTKGKIEAATANLPAPPNLDKKRPAPDFDNQVWINSPKLSLNDLKGQVVLVEFWTFGCINCQHVQPSLKKLYADYSAKGFEIISFHDPEFDYEKKLENVQVAVKDNGIKYPVAIDNDFKTWNKYAVRAWPTMYLIDKQGQIRFSHIGEGNYDLIEAAIVALLNE